MALGQRGGGPPVTAPLDEVTSCNLNPNGQPGTGSMQASAQYLVTAAGYEIKLAKWESVPNVGWTNCVVLNTYICPNNNTFNMSVPTAGTSGKYYKAIGYIYNNGQCIASRESHPATAAP